MRSFRPFLWFCAMFLSLLGSMWTPAAAQTRIENVAALHFVTSSGAQTLSSNQTTLDLQVVRLATRLSFRRLPVDYGFPGIACQTNPTISFTPGTITTAEYEAAPPMASLSTENPLMAVLEAPAENRDSGAQETVWIEVMTDTVMRPLPLKETDPNSGVFAAGLPASSSFPELAACDVTMEHNGRLRLRYLGSDYSHPSDTALLIDPEGYVFDSSTGLVVTAQRSLLSTTAPANRRRSSAKMA